MSKTSPPPSWARIRGLLDTVLDLPAPERADAVDAANADTALKQAVLSMLAAYEEETEPFGRAAMDVGELLGDRWQAGDDIGAYRLIERIGEGGMGTVFTALRADDAYSKRVAIKLIRRGWASDEEIRRFRSERQILADLEHPSIARLIDGGETAQGQPYLVMEYVDGQPIDAHCREHALGLKERLSLFLEVCRAVQFAHQSLIVHRDLKPSNVLVTPPDTETTGSTGRVKLLDFGIAKILEGSSFSGTVENTRTGSAPMTPAYASPEQVSSQPITTATDVYSLGMVLYQLLTGELPYRFDGQDLPAIVDAVVKREVTAPSSRLRSRPEAERAAAGVTPQNLRGDLDAIVLKALAKDPDRRYATAEQLADDLERYLDHRPVRARRGTVLYRGVKFLHRYRVGLAAAAATFATLVASVFVLLNQQDILVEERNRALELQRRSVTVTGYLIELFKLPDPSYSLGRQVTARELLDKSSQSIDRDLADQPQLLPELLSVLAKTYAGLGQLRESRALIDRAIRLTRAQEDQARLPLLLQQKAEVLSTEGDYPAARSALNEALVRMEGPRNREEELAYTYTLGYQGGIATWLGRFDEAERLLTSALAKAEAQGDPEVLAEVSEFNGHRLALAGDYAEASRFYSRALDIRRAQYGETTHPRILLLETASAAVTVFNDPVDGENAFRQAIDRHRTLFRGAHPILAIALNNLGRSLAKRGELAQAETYLNESLEMKREVFSAQNPSIGITLGNMGDVQRQLGRFGEAESLLDEALEILAQSVGREHADYGLVLATLASVHIGTGDLDAARPLLEEGLRIVSASTGNDTERALQIRINLSAIEERQARPESARDYLRAAIREAGAEAKASTTLTHAMLNLATLEAKLGDEEAAGALYLEIVEREGDRSQVGLFAMTHAASWAFKQERWLEAEHFADRAARGFKTKSVDEAWALAAQRTRAKAILEQGRVDRAIELFIERLARVEARFAAGQTSQKQLDRARSDLAKAESRKMGAP